MKEKQRLMMSEEEVRERAKELLNMPREELITNHLFLQQENQRLEEVIKEAREYIEKCNKEEGLSMYVDTWQHLLPLLEILSKGEYK